LIKNIKRYLLQLKRYIRRLSILQKILLVISIFFILDISITLYDFLKNRYMYNIQLKSYNSYIENGGKKITRLQDRIDRYIKDRHNIKDVIKKFRDKIDKVVFVVKRDSRSFIISIQPILFLKDRSIYKFDSNVLISNKQYNEVIDILDRYKIPYENVKNLLVYDDYISKPIIKPTITFPLTRLVSEHLFQLLIILLLIYLIYTQFNLDREKFESYLPIEIDDSFDSLIGMDDIKKEIIQLKDIIGNIKKYRQHGIDKIFNIMFSGPAGTGKTKTAFSLAKELNLPIVVGTGNVETGYVGGGARNIRKIFNQAKALDRKYGGVIVFLDEAQVLLRRRGVGREKWEDDASNELLAQLDGINSIESNNIIFIAASNFNESNFDIDEAMARRFKKKIFFRLPSFKERKDIIRFYLNKIDKKYIDSVDIDYIASITSNYSPAKIEMLINEASLIAIRDSVKIDTDILFKAFERLNIGHVSREINRDDDRLREIVILHELGHFICEYDHFYKKYRGDIDKIKNSISLLKISSESISNFDGALGYVLTNDSKKLLSKRDIEERVIQLYGGLASEHHFFGKDNITVGSHNDIEKISNLLKTVIKDLSMYREYKINVDEIDSNMFKKDIEEDISKLSQKLYSEALSRVEKHEGLILYLYYYLHKEWSLTKDELFKYIKQFNS